MKLKVAKLLKVPSEARTSPREILIQEKPENIWKVVNKGYGIPDPKKKWAKKVVKKYERWYSEHPVYTYRMFERTKEIYLLRCSGSKKKKYANGDSITANN